MGQATALIEINDGTKKGYVYDKAAHKIFIDCGGTVDAQIFVKRSPNEKYDDNGPVYSSKMTKAEIEIKEDQDKKLIALVEVNDGTKKGFVYDKVAHKIFIDCGGTANAAVFVKRNPNEKYDDNPAVYDHKMTKIEIEVKQPVVVITNGGKPYLAQNGVLQIYQQDTRLPLWILGSGNWGDRIERFENSSGSGDNTEVTFNDDQVRATVKCKQGAGEGTQKLDEALKSDFSDSQDDYKNIEQTGYAEVTEEAGSGQDQDLVWYGPTGRHTGGMKDNHDDKRGCMGSTYKGSIQYKQGKARMAKEVWHVNYGYKEWKEVGDTAKSDVDKKKKIGIKWVNFLFERDGRKVRHLELWHDIGGIKQGKPANKWKLVFLAEDDDDENKWKGDLSNGNNMKLCGCPSDSQVISWGSPGVTYRTDNTKWKLSFATVAEIVPPNPNNLHKLDDMVEPS